MNAEAWRPALIAYWKVEGCYQRAENLQLGWPLDYLDERIIAAIEAATAVMAERIAA